MSSPAVVTFRRTVGAAAGLVSTALSVGCALAVMALSFAFALGADANPGHALPLTVLWAEGAGRVLPVLAVLLAMDVWSEERRTGRIDALLSVAVREREFVIGKFFGIWFLTVLTAILSLLSTIAALGAFAPTVLRGVSAASALLALGAVALQGSVWCAAACFLSAVFRSAAVVACTGIAALVVLPRGIWAGLRAWSSAGRLSFGEMPLDAHVIDIASGAVPLGTVAAYAGALVALLFATSKTIAACRFVGRGGRALRASTGFAILLGFAAAVLLATLTPWVNPVLGLSADGTPSAVSARTHGILSETGGEATVTCFLPRSAPGFKAVCRTLRMLKRESEAIGGVRLSIRYVDPRWDIGSAERLVRKGVGGEGLVFERGRRMVFLPAREGRDERACASAIRRIASPIRNRKIYWTVGHGESGFGDYGVFGMCDIARDLAREGFGSVSLDLAGGAQVPGDCALIVIAGAKTDFSRVEIGRLEAYLREGGRLLLLLGESKVEGLGALLSAWGIRMASPMLAGARMLSGSDVIVSEFSDHPISAPLKGSRVILSRPLAFTPSAMAETGTGADRIAYSAVASVGFSAVAVSVERGGKVGGDLAVRPTRIVAVGDVSFAMNGSLAARAGANRDFFLNCAAYLAGLDAFASGDDGPVSVLAGLDRALRVRYVVWTVAVLPLGVCAAFLLVWFRKRRLR